MNDKRKRSWNRKDSKAFLVETHNIDIAKSYREVASNELITFEHLEFFLDEPFFERYMDKSKERVERAIESALQMRRNAEEEVLRQEKAEPEIKQKKGILSMLLGA